MLAFSFTTLRSLPTHARCPACISDDARGPATISRESVGRSVNPNAEERGGERDASRPRGLLRIDRAAPDEWLLVEFV